MHGDRKLLRALLSALIARQADAQLLYIPRGEAGQIRMIRALLEMQPELREDPALSPLIAAFDAICQAQDR